MILGFDPAQGAAFSTCAWTCIKRHIWRAVKAYERFESDEQLYHRACNAIFERWGLKRLPVYGEPRGKAVIFLADVWSNLTTLARLFREATAATGA